LTKWTIWLFTIVMPRTARLEFPGACYHIINRGNYRRNIFEAEGARASFEKTLFEACERSGWRLHAFVIMRNHFHLALETPEPNLSIGMKWLQATWAARFNRFRKIQGRPFQGRFKSLLVQPGTALSEVCHYIHLNPVRAKVVKIEQISQFRWSSLHHYCNGIAPACLDGLAALESVGGIRDERTGWKKYRDYLAFRMSDDSAARAIRLKRLSRGWSIGDEDFREDMRRRLGSNRGVEVRRFAGMTSQEWAAERAQHWHASLDRLLQLTDIKLSELGDRTTDPNKVKLAYLLKSVTDASNAWITAQLGMGKPATVSQNVRRFRLAHGHEDADTVAILSRFKQCPPLRNSRFGR
jgi:putative transposase